MAASVTATKPAKVPASKQPPANSVWIRYHPWIEGVMAHISAWSIHLLVIGGAILWFTYLAYALGFARPPHSLPLEAVRLENPGGGGVKTGSGTEQGGDQRARAEDVAADKANSGVKNTAVDDSDRPKLTDVVKQEIDLKFPPPDPRTITQEFGEMKPFKDLSNSAREKVGNGNNPAKGNGGTGTDGGTGAGRGPGVGTGTGPGTPQALNKREKRQNRWRIKFRHISPADYLNELQGVGAIVGVLVGPNSLEVVDLSKPGLKPEIKKLSSMKDLHWVDENPNSFQPLLAMLRLPVNASFMIAYMPGELEDELLKEELAYHHLNEDQIFETVFSLKIPGSDGRKYDVHVIEQKQK